MQYPTVLFFWNSTELIHKTDTNIDFAEKFPFALEHNLHYRESLILKKKSYESNKKAEEAKAAEAEKEKSDKKEEL